MSEHPEPRAQPSRPSRDGNKEGPARRTHPGHCPRPTLGGSHLLEQGGGLEGHPAFSSPNSRPVQTTREATVAMPQVVAAPGRIGPHLPAQPPLLVCPASLGHRARSQREESTCLTKGHRVSGSHTKPQRGWVSVSEATGAFPAGSKGHWGF